MRLDHLLSKEEEVEIVSLFSCQKVGKEPAKEQRHEVRKNSWNVKISGGDAARGHTRTHPEHDG